MHSVFFIHILNSFHFTEFGFCGVIFFALGDNVGSADLQIFCPDLESFLETPIVIFELLHHFFHVPNGHISYIEIILLFTFDLLFFKLDSGVPKKRPERPGASRASTVVKGAEPILPS